MTDRLLTPSKITAWLDCAHFLNLKHQVDAGTLTVDPPGFGSLARLLVEKGNQHEGDCLAAYRSRGLDVFEVPGRDRWEPFADWVDRIGNPLYSGHDAIYQMPFIHEGIRGIADFLIRVDHPDPGSCIWEPVDAKLARSEAKPGHVLQLCFYAEALEALTGRPPKRIHLWLGSGKTETLLTEEFQPYWRRLRWQLTALLDEDSADLETSPEPCAHCDFCEFHETCTKEWRDSDSLIYVAGLRGADRSWLEDSGVESLGQLAVHQDPVDGLSPELFTRLARQASLQVQARQNPGQPPPVEIIEPIDDATLGRGFELMPEANEGDVFLDFEGDPFWQAEAGLFFLFGLIARSEEGNWDYLALWAHGPDQEAVATGELIAYLKERRQKFPDMHVYHYNHTERSALERLTAEHGEGEAALTALVDTGFFVDLLPVVRHAMRVGTESYGLKDIEKVTGYVRGHEIDQGSAAVVEYEHYMTDGEQAHLDRIAAYNADDVRSTLALRDWLVTKRPEGLEWRPPCLDPEEVNPELNAQMEALHTYGPETPEHLLGDLLGYWWRELRAYEAPQLAKLAADTPVLLDDPEVIAGLSYQGPVERTGKKGQPLKLGGVRFHFPDQDVSAFDTDRSTGVFYSTPDGPVGYADVDRIDGESQELVLTWNQRSHDLGVVPLAIVINGWVRQKPKPEALSELATKVLDPDAGSPNGVSLALLRRELPRFAKGQGTPGGVFTDDVDAITGWVPHLDHSYVAIQGPPGTGKTYRGAHIIHELIISDKRVGIMAMSHDAIDNLLVEALKVFDKEGDRDKLRCIRKVNKPIVDGLPGVEYTISNDPCPRDEFNLVAGTSWLFSNNGMRDSPVDVLIIDEAGQLSLADAMAASRSARNLILLGDPLQLPQVTQASHPGGGGLSVLEHALGDAVTMPADRGVFLTQTRRMHPDVCRFISDQIYEGRLVSHPSCATQSTEFGTGLRWLAADHVDCSTESEEEAEMVVTEVSRLIGTAWTDQHGHSAPLGIDDFMVVAPYNDQVHLLRDYLDSNPRTRGVRVGTVDKFQGQEAPVVFFTMTASSAEDVSRGAEFLFSRNRLNVAVSRARCLAYLVCTEALLNSRARNVEEMRLISTLCAFVEYCNP